MNRIEPLSGSEGRPIGASRFHGFESLMPHRVREVLLVSSLYDSFILEEDGQISDLLLEEYQHLNLWYAPRITRVSTADEALAALRSRRRYDLVVSTMRVGEMDPFDFANAVYEEAGELPVALLGYDHHDLELIKSRQSEIRAHNALERAFIWTGDSRILFAIVSLVEDARNADHDTRAAGVEVILFVDDSIRFTSSYLPMLYTELMLQAQSTITEGVNLSQKMLRLRARPKILWAESYEEACALYERYRPMVLGVISDVRFLRDGRLDSDAGLALTRYIRAYQPDLPILLQSNDETNDDRAHALKASFAHKRSHILSQELRDFMLEYLGFGSFVFRDPERDERELARADDLRAFEELLSCVADRSLVYHATRGHFSNWLKARAEFRLAQMIKSICQSHSPRPDKRAEVERLRAALVEAMRSHRREAVRGIVADFNPAAFDTQTGVARVGGGSIGGKARGLAFINSMLTHYDRDRPAWPNVRLGVPPAVVIGTDYFDEFLKQNRLKDAAKRGLADEELRRAFHRAALPRDLTAQLRQVVDIMDYPLAVRSSSLLEDSLDQPFAGIYDTYMLPNRDRSKTKRLAELSSAIKLVYASAFSADAKAYLDAAPHPIESDKMAVIVQRLVGRPRGPRFYPSFAGVARSYNYYPFGRMTPEDGVAFIAVGLGGIVVEGRESLRFCPKRPEILPQFSTVRDILRNSQSEFDALPLDPTDREPGRRFALVRYPIHEADEDGAIATLASTYCPENESIHDGVSREGTRVVTFASVLKRGLVPLPEILRHLLDLGSWGMSAPVEIEFAVDLPDTPDEPAEFAILQMRPLVVSREPVRLPQELEDDAVFCSSDHALGNGRFAGIRDIVAVDPEQFDARHSVETGQRIGELNASLRAAERPYLLIGPGRWGSRDPWLGIPVTWGQISGVRILIETEMRGRSVEPSDGSHFFHNMTSFRVGYMTVNPNTGVGALDWEWLRGQAWIKRYDNGLLWARLRAPLTALIDGRRNEGLVLKPEGDAGSPN
ncbi:MAG: PEP/pyruvate-binding domain-containing protein [Phycisphaerales bacterium]